VRGVFNFFRHIKSAIEFGNLPAEQRRLVFYSEGKNYWVHLEGIIREFLAISDIPVCYISSNSNDPGLQFTHINFKSFEIDEGFVRDWLFQNMETEVVVMSMPDINQYQVKRSKHKVHYVYLQHSLVSLHMVYRKGAFDHYDTMFCAGPHHIKEARAIEAYYNLPAKTLVEHGYARLDDILEEAKTRSVTSKSENTPKHILIAPSWGPQGTIESGVGEKLVNRLIDQGFQVTLRPHPQTMKFAKDRIDAIVAKHAKHPLFACETDVAGQESLHESDLMIGDWSGAALDYSFGLNRPVLFTDVPRKVNNPEYEKINIEPFEVMFRAKSGVIGGDFELPPLPEGSVLAAEDHIFNVGRSAEVGAREVLKILENG
tara:strand:- start:1951 stop:3066 length:1116 start_codon:yes stop_codon:yes gene_type:complete